jgi:protein-disulfide isomerase
LEEEMAKDGTINKKKKEQQKKQDLWVILIISIIAVAIVALIVISKLPKPVTVPSNTAKPMEDGLNLGDPNAKIKVVEFADFQCPYCQLYWQQVEPTVIEKYVATNQVYYTYSPMAFLGQESIDAANAAYCANDQGKFWEYRDYLFANHTGENVGDFTQAKLLKFGQKLNLDMTAFKECVTSGKYTSKVNDSNTYAAGLNVNSTPTILVNGTAYSAGDAEKAIEDALAK